MPANMIVLERNGYAMRRETLDRPEGEEISATATAAIRDMPGQMGRVTRRGERVPSPGVDVCYSSGMEQKRATIKNISPTGVFVLTEDRWLPGTTVQLTLQHKSSGNDCSAAQARIRARIVRHDVDGVGMEFLHGKVETAKWLDLFSRATFLTAENDPVRVFRIANALAFLVRIVPSAESRILELIGEEMDRERVERAVAMALYAESLLTSQHLMPRIGVSPPLVRRILEWGSEAQDEQAQHCWAGMLASACVDEPQSHESAVFVELLAALDPIHIRILTAVGSRAIQSGWRLEGELRESFAFNLEEIKKIAGTETLVEIDAALGYLYCRGLLELTAKPLGFEQITYSNLTPTLLGLRFYARCSGQADLPGMGWAWGSQPLLSATGMQAGK